MKIACYFVAEKNLGGAERRLTRIFDSLDSVFDISIIIQSEDLAPIIEANYEIFLKEKSKVKIKVIPKGYFKLFLYTLKQHYDCVCYIDICYREIPFLLAGFFSKAKRLWMIVDTGLSYRKKELISRQLIFLFFRFFSNKVDCLYPSAEKYLSKKLKKEITITPTPFTDLKIFYPQKKNKSIVFISRLVKGKNADLFIEVIRGAQKTIRENHYSVVLGGDGEQYRELLRKIEKYGLEDIIKMVGYVNSSEYFPQANVFFSLQEIENYPSQSLIEAISCGCYIIATEGIDTKKIVKNGFGILCKKSTQVLSSELDHYINTNESQKQDIIKNARKFAIDNFRIEHSTKHFNNLFRELYKL